MINLSVLTVKQIKDEIEKLPVENYPMIVKALYADGRESVKKLALDMYKKQEKTNKEIMRIDNLKAIELSYYNAGYKYVAGCDEAGRGPLCGPVVSAVVIMPAKSHILKVNDSKKLSEKVREELYDKIVSEAVCFGVGVVDNNIIDEINILQATKLSVLNAIDSMSQKPDMLLTDALYIKSNIPQKSFVKGDANLYCIAAASIIAKVTRDRLMYEYDSIYPEYGFAQNKGYGTEAHMIALEKYGPTPIHRKTFIDGNIKHTPVNTGRKYEQLASEYLEKKGYKICCTNFKRADGEIDIIAQYSELIVFVEVKARSKSRYGTPEECVNIEKRKKIINTANRFMLERGLFLNMRFDVIAIDILPDGGCNIRHCENAFAAN